MNENLNLVEILKNVQVGEKLYSPIVGEVELVSVSTKTNDKYPICVSYCHDDRYFLRKTEDMKKMRQMASASSFPLKTNVIGQNLRQISQSLIRIPCRNTIKFL